MFESVITYNRLPDPEEEAYWSIVKKIMISLVRDPMILEFRAYRNLLGTPHVKMSIYWAEATHWANFASSSQWREIEKELRTVVTDIKIEVWGPSEYLPDPVVTASDLEGLG